MSIYSTLVSKYNKSKVFALLIDPDKQTDESLKKLIGIANQIGIDFFLLGGSLISQYTDSCVKIIKEYSNVPLVLFPGSLLQINSDADGILLLSLISGRNPDFLIGNHVVAAPLLKKSKIETIPTGYILIEGGKVSSVEYMSNTKPIPSDKTDIAVATAIAGEMKGNKLIYLEAGSGAPTSVPTEIIKEVKQNISVPLIVGGGLKTRAQIKAVCDAGADIVVVGNAIEDQPELLKGLVAETKTY
ncbi:MAG: geranylgeranylglyceryl/heptaprenylglyceryl phosphate synthase [Marinilabiliales bacterium]|nr:MAG: geranylgeranylglyceryl/heptaprenylglyceryl phosphate synthase [Marinilabiliales bacterium]